MPRGGGAWVLVGWIAVLARRSSAREYHWIVQEDVAAPDGYPRSVIAVMDKRFMTMEAVGPNPYNDKLVYHLPQQLPGPELRVRRGERVVVHITNKLPSTEISVHWHGIHMKKQAWMDGTVGVTGCAISANGGTGSYNFTIDQEPGTHWWHSHVGTQYADGLYGVIVIEPPEGEPDPVREAVPYTDDQVLTLQDWIHETYYDISARYMTRTGAFTQTIRNRTLPFLPDYPWPSSYVLLNGRGQTDCKMRLWKECEIVREYGWDYFFNQSDKPRQEHAQVNGLPSGTLGQCMPERPPLMGECNPDARPASLHCSRGGATRFRLVNAGYSMPLRFWIDRHSFMVVARDGQPVVPTGPHHALVISVGQRIDIVVQCTEDPEWRYKAFAMVALREFYPGAYEVNYEAHAFAVLGYGGGEAYDFGMEPGVKIWRPMWCPRCEKTPIMESEISPRDFTEAGLTEGCTVGCNYRRRIYSSWNIGPHDYLPFVMEAKTNPAVRKGGERRPGTRQESALAPPARERILISVGGAGNWWNNISASESQFGLKFEWWNMNQGATWTNSHVPLATTAEPVMLGNLFGRSLDDMYGTSDSLAMPFVQRLRYSEEDPVTYEIVLLNWEGQQHPWHIHGHSLSIVGHGWLDPVAKWHGHAFDARRFDPATAFDHLARPAEPAAVLAKVDTFTSGPHSFVVFRLTADNPGAWMMHCHMDYHLGAGMGMLWSVEKDGRYALPPPPDDFRVCDRDATYAGARALRELSAKSATAAAGAATAVAAGAVAGESGAVEEAAAPSSAAGAAEATGAAEAAAVEALRLRAERAEAELAELRREALAETEALRRDKDLYLYTLAGLAAGLASAALAVLLPRLPCGGASGAAGRLPDPAAAGYPRVLGSPAGSYVCVSE